MKIAVEFLSLPKVTRILGKKSIVIDFPGQTVADLIEQIATRYGPDVRGFLLDESGNLDMHFRVLLNGKDWVAREEMDRRLQEGDSLRIMMLVGGG
ncbi:MAG TPA: MoaD/ThiS family protein [Myxococcota bacterium]|nr:MoaD/ThiS family protein [Myxococcota bacterium]